MRHAFRNHSHSAMKIASRRLSGDIFVNTAHVKLSKKPIHTPNRTISNLFYRKLVEVKKESINEKSPLQIVIESIKNYFEDLQIDYSIKTSDFIDPEYPEWQEKRITIKVNATLNQIYEDIKPNMLKQLQEKLDSKYFENVILKFEMLE